MLCATAALASLGQALYGAEPEDDAAIERRLADAARYLSSDPLEGRGLGTHGIELAAEYIVRRFQELGLKTDSFHGSPFQDFQVATDATLGRENRLALVGPGAPDHVSTFELATGKDYTPLAAGDSARFDLPLVFVGYGITDSPGGYDDYSHVDVTGKAVVLLRGEPPLPKPSHARRSASARRRTLMRHKIANAYDHGALAVVFCNQQSAVVGPSSHGDQPTSLGVAGYRCSHRDVPVVHCCRAALEPAIRAVYGMDLAALETEIAREFAPHSRDLGAWRMVGRTDIHRIYSPAKNIVAVLPGDDPRVNETVVVGAHYDHLGYTETRSHGRTERAIFSGADDNASGVSAMLEIARSMAQRPHRLNRQVIFVAFSAEERGLSGSAFYVGQPLVPLSLTVAMINLDMVGRLRDDTLYVRGTATTTGGAELLQHLNTPYGLKLNLPLDRFGASDQLSFYAKKVPILHFFTGRHEDYHESTDKFEKLNIPGMRRITRLAEDVLVAIADAPVRPQYVASVPAMGQEPYFGAFGDFTRPEPGYGLGPIAQGSPAGRAGLLDGDLVVQFGPNHIASVDDFNEALAHYTGGERVRVVVKRANQSRTFDVTLGPPHP